MGLSKRRKYKNSQMRRGLTGPATAAQIARRTPITVVDAAADSGNLLTVTFDQAVVLAGVPNYTYNATAGAGVITNAAAVVGEPTKVQLTGSVATAGLDDVTVPFEDPAVRNGAAGYVTPVTFPTGG